MKLNEQFVDQLVAQLTSKWQYEERLARVEGEHEMGHISDREYLRLRAHIVAAGRRRGYEKDTQAKPTRRILGKGVS